MEELKKEIAEMKEILSQLLEIQKQEYALIQTKQNIDMRYNYDMPSIYTRRH